MYRAVCTEQAVESTEIVCSLYRRRPGVRPWLDWAIDRFPIFHSISGGKDIFRDRRRLERVVQLEEQ